jgi:hypothetical protein
MEGQYVHLLPSVCSPVPWSHDDSVLGRVAGGRRCSISPHNLHRCLYDAHLIILPCMQISIRTDRVRSREGTGKAALLRDVERALAESAAGVGTGGVGTASGTGAGAGAGSASALPDVTAATNAQPELPFPVVLRMAEEVVQHCTSLPAGGVLGSAFKVAFRNYHGRELQLKFLGQRVQLKDILERSRVVERIIVNTQPLYRCETVTIVCPL